MAQQSEARQRLGKSCAARSPGTDGHQEEVGGKYMTLLHDHVHREQPALELTLTDFVHEVDRANKRILHLENASMRRLLRLRSDPLGYRRAAGLSRRSPDDSSDFRG